MKLSTVVYYLSIVSVFGCLLIDTMYMMNKKKKEGIILKY